MFFVVFFFCKSRFFSFFLNQNRFDSCKKSLGEEVMERKQQQSSKEHHTSWETSRSDGCVRVRNFWSIESNQYNFYVDLCRRRTTISAHQKPRMMATHIKSNKKSFGTQSKRRTVTSRVPHSFRFTYKKTLINIHLDSFWAAIHKNLCLIPSFIHPIISVVNQKTLKTTTTTTS